MLTQEKEQIKTLISDISHQIKTPVAAANTFAQLLGDTGLSDEERREYIATLQMSLEKLTFLTNSLIKMSRLESGIIRLKPEQSSLNDIVMQAVKTVYAKARDKNITITFDCGQTFEALLDFNWTAEAVTNVLDNAVKYTPSGGVVDLKITEGWTWSGPRNAIFIPAQAANVAAVAAGGTAMYLPTSEVCNGIALICLGGMGCTLALNIWCLFSKSKRLKTLGRVCIAPAIFNINEPILFGTPIVFNRRRGCRCP